MSEIIAIDGIYWPLGDTHAREVITRDCAPAITALLPHIEGRGLILQAGGNVGVYALALAEHFERVVTAEPDPTNWACLKLNVSASPERHQIRMIEAAFGATPGKCAPVEVHPHNCGAHRVDFASGPVRVITIDSLGLEACDCIWGDVEGSELFMLQGAVQTIERFRPTICVEDKGLDQQFFGVSPGALQVFLGDLGYEQVDKIGRDKVFRGRK